uniref:Secreted protein n=1 Tax=Bos mutus grunniens TaxID=30521 RepID=A0A8B9Y4W2_BOSMU
MGLPGTISTINLLLQLSKLASNVSCVTIQHRCISSTDLAWMVQNNHLSCEASSFHGGSFCCHQPHCHDGHLDRHVLDIKAHIVPRKGFTQCFMVHFYRLHFSCYIDWSKVTTMPGLRTPVSTRPTGTVPIPPIL